MNGGFCGNLAIGLGNALRITPSDPGLVDALKARLAHPAALVREHVEWALQQARPAYRSTPSANGRLSTPSVVDRVTNPATNGPL